MTVRPHNVSLPIQLPTTEALREACSAIVRDLMASHGLTAIELAGKLNVHPNTVGTWLNRKNDIGSLMIATIGVKFGVEAVAPYHALYDASAHGIAAQDAAPLTELADALAALTRANGPKARLDSLPTLKTALEGLSAYVVSLERWRNAA